MEELYNIDQLTYDEVGRLTELGLLDEDLLPIYIYVKNGSIGTLDLSYSRLTYLPNWLTKVDGDLDMYKSDIEDIPDSLKIKGSIYAQRSKLKEFRKSEVFGHLFLNYTQITNLPDGLIIDGYLGVEGIQFEQFPKNLVIKGNFYIKNSNLEQFTNTELRKMYEIHEAIIKTNF
jgi:hypothetical protein